MLSIILGFVTGLAGPISNIAGKIVDLKSAKLIASNDLEKKQIDAQIEEAHDRKAILIAEAGDRLATMMNVGVRTAIGGSVAALLGKIFVWDKVVGSLYHCTDCFRTDPLDTNLWWVVFAVIGFYFAYDIAARLKK